MGRKRSYPAAFRQQMVNLVRSGRSANDLAKENEDIYGCVTAGGLSKSLRHLIIRCVVRNGDKPLSLVYARLSVDMYDPEYFDYHRMRTFYVAITDTIAANETRIFYLLNR